MPPRRKAKGRGKRPAAARVEVEPFDYDPIVAPAEDRIVDLTVKMLNWGYMDFTTTLPLTTPLIVIRQMIAQRFGGGLDWRAELPKMETSPFSIPNSLSGPSVQDTMMLLHEKTGALRFWKDKPFTQPPLPDDPLLTLEGAGIRGYIKGEAPVAATIYYDLSSGHPLGASTF